MEKSDTMKSFVFRIRPSFSGGSQTRMSFLISDWMLTISSLVGDVVQMPSLTDRSDSARVAVHKINSIAARCIEPVIRPQSIEEVP